MKKIKIISILLCSLFGLTGCGGLSLLEGLIIADVMSLASLAKTEQIKIERINYYYDGMYDEKKTD